MFETVKNILVHITYLEIAKELAIYERENFLIFKQEKNTESGPVLDKLLTKNNFKIASFKVFCHLIIEKLLLFFQNATKVMQRLL